MGTLSLVNRFETRRKKLNFIDLNRKKMANRLIESFKKHKPLWVMGTLLIVSHIGWKRLQTIEGIHPSGPDPEDHPMPLTRVLMMVKAKITGSGGTSNAE